MNGTTRLDVQHESGKRRKLAIERGRREVKMPRRGAAAFRRWGCGEGVRAGIGGLAASVMINAVSFIVLGRLGNLSRNTGFRQSHSCGYART